MAEPAVALLIAIPTTLDDLIGAIRGKSDYTRRYADDPGHHWSMPGGYRESVAEPLTSLADLAAETGARVTLNASLSDLSAATQTSAVTIVVAHWKGSDISARDLATDEGSILAEALAGQTDPDLVHLAKLCRRASNNRSRLVEAMNGTIERMADRHLRAAKKSAGTSRFAIMPQTAKARARKTLDEALGAHIHPGERVELADGLHTVEAVDRAVASDFRGVLDLTTCTSMILADQLSALRNADFRCVQFEQALPPAIAALMLRQTLATAQPGADRYLVARKAAIEDVAHAIAGQATKALNRRSWFPTRRP